MLSRGLCMYSHLFYIIMWAVCFVLVIPVLIVGVIYVFMSNKPPKKVENTMQIMFNIIKGAQTKPHLPLHWSSLRANMVC